MPLPTPSMKLAGVAIHQMLKDNLGVDVTVRTADRSAYMSMLMDWEMPFGFLRFVADYVDPRNMLDMTWHSQPKGVARHDWQVAAFDRMNLRRLYTHRLFSGSWRYLRLLAGSSPVGVMMMRPPPTEATLPADSLSSTAQESCATRFSIPVATRGASEVSSGTA